jgi:parallel beta-helix repeat protein
MYFWGLFQSNKISDNNCSDNIRYGLKITGDLNIMNNNSFNENGDCGMRLEYLDYNTITNNSIIGNGEEGILVHTSTYIHMESNNISFNKHGLYLINTHDSEVVNNSINDNRRDAIYCDNCWENSYYHNFISGEPDQLVTSLYPHDCTWNNTDNEGNYWSDYDGIDDGSGGRTANDGIGDTNIPHYSLDRYPFTRPWGWLYPPTPILDAPDGHVTSGSYMLSWTKTARTTGYKLQECTNETFNDPTVIYKGPQRIFNITEQPNGTYYYRVRALNGIYSSYWSDVEVVRVDWAPDIPSNFRARAVLEGNALNVSWDLNVVDTVEYHLYDSRQRDTGYSLLATLDNTTDCYIHSDLNDGQNYYYKIRAKDHRGALSAYSEPIRGVPADSIPPPPPEIISIEALSHDSVMIQWAPGVDEDIQSYNIYRSEIPEPEDWGSPIHEYSTLYLIYTDTYVTEVTTYYYAITVLDEVPNESSFSEVVSVTTPLGPHGPEVNNTQPDVEMDEDTVDDTSINLYHWFMDPNGDPLTFDCEGIEHINVEINRETGAVTLIPEENWCGEETLTFYAADDTDEISEYVYVTVLPVNDPPGPARILEPHDGLTIDEGEPIMFVGTCEDPDLEYGDILTYNWTSHISGSLGSEERVGNVQLPAGEHIITLDVSDEEVLSATANITVIVIGPEEPEENITDGQEPGDGDDDDDDDRDITDKEGEGYDMNMVGLGIAVAIIAIAAVLLLMMMMMRQKKKAEEEEKQAEPPPPEREPPPWERKIEGGKPLEPEVEEDGGESPWEKPGVFLEGEERDGELVGLEGGVNAVEDGGKGGDGAPEDTVKEY